MTRDEIKGVFDQSLEEFLPRLQELKKEPAPDIVLLTMKEACAFLSICRSTLISQIKKGNIPYNKIGRKTFINKQSLVNILNSKTIRL